MSAAEQVHECEWTIGRLIGWTTKYLADKGVPDARLSAEVLLAHVLSTRRIDLYARFESEVEAEPRTRFRELVQRAAEHEPTAYLVGQKEFFSLSFRVTRDVLIPRPETEVLVERVIDHCRAVPLAAPRLLDVGTGSGCIAIALLTQLKDATTVATDIAPGALAIARENAERHGVSDRCVIVEADRLTLPPECVPSGGFDVLMSNPPYIPSDRMAELDAAVKDFEPHAALGDGGDGLSFYRTIGEQAADVLQSNGVVFVEIDDGRADAVIDAVETGGSLVHRTTWKDQTVGRDRVLMFAQPGADDRPPEVGVSDG